MEVCGPASSGSSLLGGYTHAPTICDSEFRVREQLQHEAVRTVALLVLAVAILILAIAGIGAWQLDRLNSKVDGLRRDQATRAGFDRRLGESIAAISQQAAKLRASGLRQDFETTVQEAVLELVVVEQAGNLSCAAADQRWRRYVNASLIPYVDKHRALKAALRSDDPNYEATLLNDFPACSA